MMDVETTKEVPFKKMLTHSTSRFISMEDQVPFLIPRYLECYHFCFKYVMFCCHPSWYKEYRKNLNYISVDMSRNLDVLDFMRRLRMHGLALTMTSRPEVRKFVSGRSYVKMIREISELRPKSLW
jgi:hypothetical protein